MRRHSTALLIGLFALSAVSPASGQDFSFRPRTPRVWLSVSDAFGPNGGGLLNTTGFVQIFRGAAFVRFTERSAIEVGAMRIQEVFPATKVSNDRMLNDPEADGVTLSFASLRADGQNGGFPSAVIIGAGLMRRPTNEFGVFHLTSGIVGGLESGLLDLPVDWADLSAGVRIILLPAGNRHQLYILALTGGIRIG